VHVGTEVALINTSLHYKRRMIGPVAPLTLYMTQRNKVIGLTRLRRFYVLYTSRLIHKWRRL